jgi:hypothetical protein
MVRKLRDFLKDETATTAIEYGLVAAGLAVVMVTAIRPANPSPACPTCGLPMRLVTRIPKFSLHPELRAHKFRKCEKTAMEEWEPGKRGSISQRFLAAPILLCLALNRRPDRIVDLAPMVDTAGPIGRGSPFRNDTACGVRDFFALLAKDVIRRCRGVIKICPPRLPPWSAAGRCRSGFLFFNHHAPVYGRLQKFVHGDYISHTARCTNPYSGPSASLKRLSIKRSTGCEASEASTLD